MRGALTVVVFGLALLGCGGDDDSGVDAGSRADGGSRVDGGRVDGGGIVDGGSSVVDGGGVADGGGDDAGPPRACTTECTTNLECGSGRCVDGRCRRYQCSAADECFPLGACVTVFGNTVCRRACAEDSQCTDLDATCTGVDDEGARFCNNCGGCAGEGFQCLSEGVCGCLDDAECASFGRTCQVLVRPSPAMDGGT